MEYQAWRAGAVEGPHRGPLLSLHLIFIFLAPKYALHPIRQVAVGKTQPFPELSAQVFSRRSLRPWNTLWLHSSLPPPPSLEAQNQMPLDRAVGRAEAGWARPLGLPCWAASAVTSAEFVQREPRPPLMVGAGVQPGVSRVGPSMTTSPNINSLPVSPLATSAWESELPLPHFPLPLD